MVFPPERIICLTEETVETLYLLGVSGYAVRRARVRKEKPRVSAFTSADIPKIMALEPDLVFTFSDLQAEIVASLIREGIEVHAFNQRSVAGILDMVRMVGAIVAKPQLPAVRSGTLHEIKSPLILQPGPAALTDGARAIANIIRAWSEAAAVT